MVEGDCHPIFTQDPARWMQYMYRKVRVVTTAQQEHVGHVYTVDPVTGSFVLVQSPTLADSSDTVAAFNATTTTTTTGSICSSDTIADTTTTTTTTTTDTTTTTTMDTDSSSVTATTTTTTATAITANPITTTISAAFKANMEVCVIPGHAVAEVVVLPEKDKEKEEEGIKKEDDVINDDDHHGARQQGDSSNSSSCSSGSSSEHMVKVKAMLDSLFLKTPCQTEWNGNTTTTTTMGHLSAEALEERKERLKDWLLKNRLPVEEEEEDCDDSGGGGLCVAGAVSIQPPYSAADCFGTNEIILSRIQKLVKNMPTSV